jgi:hypothetical protein
MNADNFQDSDARSFADEMRLRQRLHMAYGCVLESRSNAKDNRWDIECYDVGGKLCHAMRRFRLELLFPDDAPEFVTVEHKFDEEATRGSEDIAIEIEDRSFPSGLSATQATFWVHSFDGRWHCVPTSVLRRFMIVYARSFMMKHGGNGNLAIMVLVPKHMFMDLKPVIL